MNRRHSRGHGAHDEMTPHRREVLPALVAGLGELLTLALQDGRLLLHALDVLGVVSQAEQHLRGGVSRASTHLIYLLQLLLLSELLPLGLKRGGEVGDAIVDLEIVKC